MTTENFEKEFLGKTEWKIKESIPEKEKELFRTDFDRFLERVLTKYTELKNGRKCKDYRTEIRKKVEEFQNKLIEEMKSQDSLFRQLFTENSISGSYRDKLKVGKFDEFDVNF